MKSKQGLYDFEEAKLIVHSLCDLCGIPVPVVKMVDAVGYLGEQIGLEIRLRKENDMETIVHEWLHYLFSLVFLEKLHWDEKVDQTDDLEHRIVLFLEPLLAKEIEKLYKKVMQKNKRGK